MHPHQGDGAFGDPDLEPPAGWRPHAIALVNAAVARNLTQHRAVCEKTARTAGPQDRYDLVKQLAIYARTVCKHAGGVQHLLHSADVHHTCARQFMSSGQRKLIASPAALAAAFMAHKDWDMAQAVLMRLGTVTPDASHLMLHLWIRVTAGRAEFLGPMVSVPEPGRAPEAVITPDIDSSDLNIRTASLFHAAVGQIQSRAGEESPPSSVFAPIDALSPQEMDQILWHAVANTGSVLAQERATTHMPHDR